MYSKEDNKRTKKTKETKETEYRRTKWEINAVTRGWCSYMFDDAY